MTLFLSILIIVICFYLYNKSKQDKTNSEFEEINNKANPSNKPNSREHVLEALKELGCQPQINDDTILAVYQGENFKIEADDNYKAITIYNPWWGWLDLDDRNTENLKEAINKCNAGNCIPTMLYTISDDKIGVHCKLTLNFVNRNDRYDILLAAYFRTFFDAHEMLRSIFDNEIKTEQEKKPRTVIKGFSQYKESN